jgi:hypothetical protein
LSHASKREAVERARRRLDTLDLYPRPVRIGRVRIVVAPWLFRLPFMKRWDGYATHLVIFLRSRRHVDDNDLVTHELCHVWQMQHHPVRMPLSYIGGYAGNRHEAEARQAAELTRGTP